MGVFKKFVFATLVYSSLWAMPAANRVHHVSVPDGSSLALRSVGNEIYNYKLTEDGYAVARDSLGYFRYIDEDGSLTNVRVRDLQKRTSAEIEFLSSLDRERVAGKLRSRLHRREYQNFKKSGSESFAEETTSSSMPMLRMPKVDANLNSGERKALVVLVQFDDTKFTDEDPQAEFDKYLNQTDYNVNKSIGSVRDYFRVNSSDKFIPNFDVVGPITLPGSAFKDYGSYSRYGSEGARVMLSRALDSLKARGTVDFKQYDNDGDQILDFVHMIYAGVGSNDSDLDSAMWPHMWDMRAPGEFTNAGLKQVASSGNGFSRKNYYVGPYACSNELDGVSWSNGKKIRVGVGPFIHEFSHLLGLGDHYATNGESIYTLGNWDVMDGGAYNCPFQEYPISCAPPYYSAFERMYLGWMKATEITAGNGVQLLPISENTALKVTNPKNSNEFYLLEYRNRRGWDIGLPNHGMLIWHIDYVDTVWLAANINSSRKMHVDIVEADGKANIQTITADVFPGTSWGKKYTSFDQFVTWDGTDLGVSLTKITEEPTYNYVSFNVNGDSDYEESSSSEVAESSSAEETELSSSGMAESSSSGGESSSSEVVKVSSSSEEAPASSSAEKVESSSSEKSSSSVEVVAPESSSSESVEPPKILRGILVPGLNISRSGGILQISGMPQGDKVLRVFSLNGNLLLTQQVDGVDLSLEMDRHFGKMPVVIQVKKDQHLIMNALIR